MVTIEQSVVIWRCGLDYHLGRCTKKDEPGRYRVTGVMGGGGEVALFPGYSHLKSI